jgi:hypothetical protein
VHPAPAGYQVIVEGIVWDLANAEGRYTNVPKGAALAGKKQRLDLSLDLDAWVRGCIAALPYHDSHPMAIRGARRSRTASAHGGGSAKGAISYGRSHAHFRKRKNIGC